MVPFGRRLWSLLVGDCGDPFGDSVDPFGDSVDPFGGSGVSFSSFWCDPRKNHTQFRHFRKNTEIRVLAQTPK